MSNPIGDPGHGNSPAAWTAVTIMLVGFTVGVAAFFFDVPWLVWACAGVMLIGIIVGWIMAKSGYGVGGDKHSAKAH